MVHAQFADASDAIWPGFVRPEASAYRFVLIDHLSVVRHCIGSLLSSESDLAMVGDSGDLDAGIELVRRVKPDLVICDLNLPHCPGVTTVRRLCGEFHDAHVLVLTACDSLQSMRESFAAGAIGYVRKNATRADLVRTLRCAAAGQRVVCLGTMERLARIWLVGKSAKNSHRKTLSLDEEVILRLIALGVPTRQIAADLRRGMRAVGKQRMQLMRRLNLRSIAAVTQFAVALNLVSLGEIGEPSRRNGTYAG
jgi:DNA-binding NarL/FixJ family response regulator